MTQPQFGQIDIDGLHIQLGEANRRFEALQDVSIHMAPGELVCVLGPSGCGKSTLLGALAGHLAPSSGSVRVDGVAVAGPHPDRGLVFQHHTLFPWQRVLDNVAFGLKMKGIARRERHRQAHEMLQLVGLQDFAHSYPAHLSGGMQQRVEIARVLINHPRVMLMDEPFGALDAQTRLKMQELLLAVWARINTTILFITHDIDEALFLADHPGHEPAAGAHHRGNPDRLRPPTRPRAGDLPAFYRIEAALPGLAASRHPGCAVTAPHAAGRAQPDRYPLCHLRTSP